MAALLFSESNVRGNERNNRYGDALKKLTGQGRFKIQLVAIGSGWKSKVGIFSS